MLAGNYLQSNILHFYHLGGQDYFHGPDTVPFIPRYRNPDLRLSEEQNTLAMDEYIEALEVRQVCHQLVALFGGVCRTCGHPRRRRGAIPEPRDDSRIRGSA